MLDLRGLDLFDAAQSQIIILRTFEPDAKTTNLADQISSINAEVGDEILRQKKLGIPIGFKMRFEPSISFVKLVLITVEQLQVTILVQRQSREVQCRWRQFVVVIEQRNKIAGC